MRPLLRFNGDRLLAFGYWPLKNDCAKTSLMSSRTVAYLDPQEAGEGSQEVCVTLSEIPQASCNDHLALVRDDIKRDFDDRRSLFFISFNILSLWPKAESQ